MMRVVRWRALGAALCVAAGGCDGGGATAPDAAHGGDPVRGAALFEEFCSGCHVNRDAFDLAAFGFDATDIVRRGVAHVDTAAALDIAAHVASLDAPELGRHHRLFQPTGRMAASDEDAWRAQFGTDGWPEDLSPEGLARLDLTSMATAVTFPLWSSEGGAGDWMPDRPLAPDLLALSGGALQTALDAYFDEPTGPRLGAAVEVFHRVSTSPEVAAHPVCEGSAGTHPRPRECFEARRWMSALTALHALRYEPDAPVPFAVARLWWEVGEVAQTLFFDDRSVDRAVGASWLYMSSAFAPGGFPGRDGELGDAGSYLGGSLQSSGWPRAATLVTLRRMVHEGPLQDAFPEQPIWDLRLAVLRAPDPMKADVLRFGFDYLLDRPTPGDGFSVATRRQVGYWLDALDTDVESVAAERRDELRVLARRLRDWALPPPWSSGSARRGG